MVVDSVALGIGVASLAFFALCLVFLMMLGRVSEERRLRIVRVAARLSTRMESLLDRTTRVVALVFVVAAAGLMLLSVVILIVRASGN